MRWGEFLFLSAFEIAGIAFIAYGSAVYGTQSWSSFSLFIGSLIWLSTQWIKSWAFEDSREEGDVKNEVKP